MSVLNKAGHSVEGSVLNKKSQGSLCQTRRGRFIRGLYARQTEAGMSMPTQGRGIIVTKGEANESMPDKARQV